VAGRFRYIEKINDLIGNRTRDLRACSIVPQPTTLPRAQLVRTRVPRIILVLFNSTYLDNRLTDGGEVVSLKRRSLFIRRKTPGTHFC
jgi:hypothetical protein